MTNDEYPKPAMQAPGWMTIEIAELTRLRKIEADARAAGMLTEDGALIVPGMPVWVPGKWPMNGIDGDAFIVGTNNGHATVDGWMLSALRSYVGKPYSTRAAAEAAKKEQP
jgi:hypothetical protein